MSRATYATERVAYSRAYRPRTVGRAAAASSAATCAAVSRIVGEASRAPGRPRRARLQRGRVGGDHPGLGEVAVERGQGGQHPPPGTGLGARGVERVQPCLDVGGRRRAGVEVAGGAPAEPGEVVQRAGGGGGRACRGSLAPPPGRPRRRAVRGRRRRCAGCPRWRTATATRRAGRAAPPGRRRPATPSGAT